MPLTNPADYEPQGGVDPRDENHPFSPRKPKLQVFLKPLSQKVIEKHLWLEVTLIILICIIGATEMLGEQVSSAMFFMLGALTTAVLYRFIHIEDETHSAFTQKSQKVQENEKV